MPRRFKKNGGKEKPNKIEEKKRERRKKKGGPRHERERRRRELGLANQRRSRFAEQRYPRGAGWGKYVRSLYVM